MDRLRKVRTPVRASITRIANEVDAELAKTTPGLLDLQVMFSRLEKHLTEVDDLDQKMLGLLLDADCTEDEYAAEKDTIEQYQNRATRAKCRIGEVMTRVPSTQGSPTSSYASVYSDGQKKKSYKLPKIQIRKFNGEIKEWLGFWSQFKKIHEDEELHDKLQYLVQSMVNGTRAHDLVTKYPQTAENYPKAVAALQQRFGNTKLLTQFYVRELLKMTWNAKSKEKMSLSKLYDSLDSHLQALDSLGVTREHTFLFPMVESSLQEDILLAWQRSSFYRRDGAAENPPKSELDYLMEFLRQEVENEEQRSLARDGFMQDTINLKEKKNLHLHQKKFSGEEDIPTSAGLTAAKMQCIFCDMTSHNSQDCRRARNMTIDVKREKVREKRVCYICLNPGHISKTCRVAVQCQNCGRKHQSIMCEARRDEGDVRGQDVRQQVNIVTHLTNFSQNADVLLKVVVVRAVGPVGTSVVRLLIDEGSQMSYIGSRTIQAIGNKSIGVEYVRNLLLGGFVTDMHAEKIHEVKIESLDGKRKKKWTLREKPIICTSIPRVPKGPWTDRLRNSRIFLSDCQNSHVDEADIEILVGSDLRAELCTGKKVELGANLIAEETIFGWVLSGPIPAPKNLASNLTIAL